MIRWLALALVATACSESSTPAPGEVRPATEEPPSAAAPPRPEEDRPSPPAPREGAAPSCTLEAPFASRPMPGEVIAVARARDGDALVVVQGEGALVPLAIAEASLEAGPSTGAGALLALEALDAGYLVLSSGPCTTDDAARCLLARAVGQGSPIELPERGRPRSLKVVATDGMVYVARSFHDARPTLDRFARAEAGLAHTRRTVGEALREDEPVEMLALAADGAAYALVYRHGAAEDSESGVVLATQLDEHEVEVLHDALVIEAIAWVGTSVAMIAAFEFARPAYLRLGAEGGVRVAPREVPFGLEAPEPFGGRLIARAVGSAGAFSIEVRSAAGDRRGEAIPLAGARAVDLTREPGGFLVAWTDGSAVHVAHLRC